jgi:hypothetical protein
LQILKLISEDSEMNNLIKTCCLAIAAITACACSTQQGSSSSAPQFLYIDWTVQAIDGKAVLPDAKPTIRFSNDNRVSGSATCNRLVGSYKLEGEKEGRKIDIEPLGTTMMACPPEHNLQERTFLDIINEVGSVQVLDDGTLLLDTNDGKTISATRSL